MLWKRRRPPPAPVADDETLLWVPHGEPPAGAPARPRSRARRAAVRLAKWALALFAAYYVVCVALLVVYRFVSPPTTGVQAQRRVEAWIGGREYAKERDVVPIDSIPEHVARAVVAAEDGRFWDHRGFDWTEMRKARDEVGKGVRMRGASTITQQLMKNLFGCACRNPVRKVYDLTLTPAAELILGKNRILELYLNQVEWGEGVYGIEAAARHHYDVSAQELSRTQAAGLAALLPNPRRRTPGNTGWYRGEILRRMRARGW